MNIKIMEFDTKWFSDREERVLSRSVEENKKLIVDNKGGK